LQPENKKENKQKTAKKSAAAANLVALGRF
jgi:hypothetical protein